MSQIWKKMKKSEMRKTFSGEKVFHFMLKSNCPKLRKTGTKSISTHVAKHCFRVAFSRIPICGFRGKPSIWERIQGAKLPGERSSQGEKHLSEVEKNHRKSICAYGAKRCFRVAFFTYPHMWISRETFDLGRKIWREPFSQGEKRDSSPPGREESLNRT